MPSAKWMRTGILAVALLAIAGVIAVVACGPSAQSGGNSDGGEGATIDGSDSGASLLAPGVSVLSQESGDGSSEGKKSTPTPTATLHPDCVKLTYPEGGSGISCPPPGPENVEGNLRRHYNHVMKLKQEAAEGRRSPVEPVYIFISVEMTTHEAVDAVALFLEENGDGGKFYTWKYGEDEDPAGAISAGYVNIELVPQIAAIEGVKLVYEERGTIPLSSLGGPSSQVVPSLMGADQWHAVGVKGAGVGVAVIDRGFQDFETRIMPFLSEPARFLCYDERRNAVEGFVPTLTPSPGSPSSGSQPAPTPKFSACKVGPESETTHGIEVLESLLEISPDVKLYFSDPVLPPH